MVHLGYTATGELIITNDLDFRRMISSSFIHDVSKNSNHFAHNNMLLQPTLNSYLGEQNQQPQQMHVSFQMIS